MGDDKNNITERIIKLTLKNLHLLFEEDYIIMKKSGDQLKVSSHSRGLRGCRKSPDMKSPSCFITSEKNDKILEVTKNITELLTGEVPIRCQDVTVYFSMEEWEYLEGHKDLYKDVMKEDQLPLTSPALSPGRFDPLISPSPNCMNEDSNILINPFLAKCSPSEEQNTETSCKEEEHVPYSDITVTNIVQDMPVPLIEEHLSREEHLPISGISTHCMPSSSKEETLTAEEHLTSNIFTPIHHTQSPSSPIKEWSLSAEEPSSLSNIPSPADHIQYISIQIMEEQLPSGEMEHLQHISTTTHHGQSDLKEDSLSAKHVPHPDVSLSTDLTQLTPSQGFLYSEHVPHSDISTPAEQIQYISIQITEGPLSCKVEHLPHPEISTLTQSTLTEIKDEPPSAVEHLPYVLTATHHVPSTDIDVKEEVSAVEHLPHILKVTHRVPSTTTAVKEEVPSAVEHHPHPRISASTYCTQSTTPHDREKSLSAPGHFPHHEGLTPSYHTHSTPPHIKEDHTRSPRTHVKEEPFSREGNHPSSCNLKPRGSIQNTSTPIKEDSNPCKKGSLSITEPSCSESGRCSPPRLSHPTPIMHTKQRPFVCGECGRCYSIISNLEMHMKTHTGDKLYKCWECGEAFGEASLLAVHHQRHAAEKEHINATSARDHARDEPSSSTHGGKGLPKEQTFICSKCGGRFSSKSNLNVHAKLHTGVKPYCCPECGKGFTSKSALNKHWKYHTGDKPPACPECGRSFDRQASLTRHMTVHTSRKHFCCSKCGKCFRRKTALMKHRQIHSKLPEEDPRSSSGEKDSYDMSHETL